MLARVRRAVALPLSVLCLVAMAAGEPRAALLTGDPGTGVISGLMNTVTLVVNGAIGGMLARGIWTVQVPSGAFTGSASITMTTGAADPTVCSLAILPADKNGFANPAVIQARIPAGMSPSSARIEWLNPQTNTWVPVQGSTVNLLTRTVSAKIWHFSTYRVDGRSGW